MCRISFFCMTFYFKKIVLIDTTFWGKPLFSYWFFQIINSIDILFLLILQKLDYRWYQTAKFEADCYINCLSWNIEGRYQQTQNPCIKVIVCKLMLQYQINYLIMYLELNVSLSSEVRTKRFVNLQTEMIFHLDYISNNLFWIKKKTIKICPLCMGLI